MSRDRSLIEQWLGEGAGIARKEQNVRQDRYDRTIFNDVRENSNKINELERRGTNIFPALLRDFWATFYKAEPELEDERLLDQAHRVNRPFVERLLEDHSTEEIRITTMLDELSSAVAAAAAGGKMLAEINEREELQKAMQQAQEAARRQEAGDADGAQTAADEAIQRLNAAARDIRRAVREAVKAGQEKAQEFQQVLAGWGIESGDLAHMPIGDRLKLTDALIRDAKMKRIADLVGRMRNLARARQRQKVKKRRDEIHSITIGADLNHVLPAELAALRHPLQRLDFYRRFTEKRLLQYDLQGREKLARGPIVAAIDVSGSMQGGPLEWAIACALALADTASRQKRHCHILFFDTEVKQEFSFTPGERDAEKYMSMASIAVAGGTDYAPALQRAMQYIAGGNDIPRPKEFENADIVMVTDGICRLDDKFLNHLNGWKDTHKISCYAILLGYDSIAELERWNDKVWQIRDLAGDGDVAGDLFEEVY